MAYKLVLCDMDGTLVRSNHSVSAFTVSVLQKLRDNGILFVPATGRFYLALPKELRDPSLARYCALINGALLYDARENRALRRADIAPKRALEILDFLAEYPVTRDVYMNDAEAWMDRCFWDDLPYWILNPYSYDLITRTRKPVDDLRMYLRERNEPVQKVQGFFRDNDIRRSVMEALAQRFPEMLVYSAVPFNVEITNKDADKGKCLAFLTEHLGIAPEEVIAFGDEENDLTMLALAGTGVAMGNASERVKASAALITESNDDDGVAKALLRWVL